MKVLIKQARIISPSSPHHGKTMDILVNEGIILRIADKIEEATAQIVQHPQLHVSIGWVDLFAGFGDPGFEHRETIESGAAAAAAGGFTTVLITPNTQPVVSTKTQVEYIKQKGRLLPVDILPIGAITKQAEGKELAEMYDMQASGAVAFGDGWQSLQHAGILLKALQYVQAKDALVIQLPNDQSIAPHGLMNEGITSTQLGLPGKPAIAEELIIARDIELLKYTQSKLHITGVSTKKGIERIQQAKHEGLKLSCSVTPYHCFFCDEDLVNYNTHLKVNPPLRTREDMMAVREAVASGVVDCIASHHHPLHWDEKNCEFEYAKNGMETLEAVFGAMHSFAPSLDRLIEQLTTQPRTLLGLPLPKIQEGEAACLTLFNPSEAYTFNASMIQSASKNNAFIGQKLTGKVLGILNKNQLVLQA